MTGCLANAFAASFRNAQRYVALGLALSVPGLAGGCNGFFPGGNSGQDNPTEFSETQECATAYSDAEFHYGFDLPSDAELVRTKNESNSLTNSLWTITESGALINIITRVQAASQDAVLGTVVTFANDLSISAGADLLSEEEVTLSNGGEGIQTTIRFDGLTTFRVQSLSNARLFVVEAVIEEAARTADMDSLLAATVLSLCVE
jgi:hypothetical protein